MEPHFCVTRACPWSLPRARWRHSWHPVCLRLISLLLPHMYLNRTSAHLFSEFLAKVFFVFLVYLACWVFCPSYPVFEHRNYILHPSSFWIKFCWLLWIFTMQATFYPHSCPQLGLPSNAGCCIRYLTKVYLRILCLSWVPHGIISSS
jgi:hypothetical protein